MLAEARVEADRILAALEQALAVDGELLSRGERAAIDAQHRASSKTAARGDDHAAHSRAHRGSSTWRPSRSPRSA